MKSRKLDVGIYISAMSGDIEKQERIELKPHTSTLITVMLPETFRGRIARLMGIPPMVQVEIAPAKRGRPSGKN